MMSVWRWFARALLCLCLFASTSVLSRAQEASPDRIVAEWMLRMGGSVILEGQRRPITDLADLPTSDFRIHTLNFTGITQWGFALEDELKRLPPLPHLKELYVNGRLWYDQPVPLVASTMRVVRRLDRARETDSEQAGPDLHSLRRHAFSRARSR